MTQKEFDKLVKQLNEYSLDIMANKRPEYTNENEDVLKYLYLLTNYPYEQRKTRI